jgi:hypothetical protein
VGVNDFLTTLLAGGADYRVTPDLGGAVFGPVDDSDEALRRFERIAGMITANDGRGYTVVRRLTHRTSDRSEDLIDRMVINTRR